MGSVQRLATVVIVGLVALSTILFLYLGDEDNRITAKDDSHQEAAIARAESNYVALCLQCHGPAGEGYTAPGEAGTGRVGAPLGGVNTSLNQEGVLASGTPWPGGFDARTQIIHDTIYDGLQNPDGSYRMPAFGGAAGSLTDAQIDELVVMVQNVDWNSVYNYAVEDSGGYPTPPPAAVPDDPEPDDGGDSAAVPEGVVVIESLDIFFEPSDIEIPADTAVTVSLPNNGMAPHNFAIDELGISVDLAPGETKEIEINAPAGEYEFYCNVPGHREAGMVGILTITEGAELPSGGAAADEEGAAQSEGDGTGEEEAAAEEGAEAATTITVESYDIYFDPTEIEIRADTDVTVSLPNLGAAPHNFAIDELDISVDLAPGETNEVVINAPAGEYEFYCNVPGHREAGMVGTLTVTEGGEVAVSDQAADSSEADATDEAEADADTTDEGSASEEEVATGQDISEESGALALTGDVERGEQLAGQCLACHSVDGSQMVGPTWQGLYGSTSTLDSGESVTVDEAYLLESIVDPTAKIVEGYPPAMPPYSTLSDQDLADLVAYIKSLE